MVESEAEIVRMIYRWYMDGKTMSAIARDLVRDGIPSPGGKKIWQPATVQSILTNEKYKGDALLQKCFTVDFLTKKIKRNEGEIPQYYVQNSHPGIIDPDEFDEVQAEIRRRKNLGRPVACVSPLSTKLVCGDCGGFYGSKVWDSNTKYRKVIWRCNDKYKVEKKCTTPHLVEEEVKGKFVEAFNSILPLREELIANCRMAKETLCDHSLLDRELDDLVQKLEAITALSRKAIQEHAHGIITQDEWTKQSDGLNEQNRQLMARMKEIEELKREKRQKAIRLDAFIREMGAQTGPLIAFDEPLWMAAIDQVLVSPLGKLTFRFKDGTEVCR